jgi:hypothetical protein
MSRPLHPPARHVKRTHTQPSDPGGASSAVTKRLDGTLAAVVNEISALHSEILSAARTSLSKAIKVGGLLCRVRASRKGEWLKWIDGHLPFTDRTARSYIYCFERRAELENVSNLTEAYALLSAPSKRAKSSNQELGDGTHNGSKIGVGPNNSSEPQSSGQSDEAPAEPQPQRRHKSQKQIMKELQQISDQERETEKHTDAQLSEIITGLSPKVRAQWLEFPDRLATHGKALSELAEGLKLNTPRA